jgi:hypothetical protein
MGKSQRRTPKGTKLPIGSARARASRARERANRIAKSVPFYRQRSELDPETGEVRFIHDGQRWPNVDESIDEITAVLALQRDSKDARSIAARYLREMGKWTNRPRDELGRLRLPRDQTAISIRVLAQIADMLDPPTEDHKLSRYNEIGRHCQALRDSGRSAKEAVYETVIELAVSERDVYRGLRVIAGKSPEGKKTEA